VKERYRSVLLSGVPASPLFDVLINLPPVGIIGSTPEFSDIRVSAFVDREREISKFDLSFIFVELGEELRIGIEYNSDMYDRDTVERMGDHLAGLMGAIVECPDMPSGELEYLSAAERHQLLTTFNARYASKPALVVYLVN
jgi:hypothetical protein